MGGGSERQRNMSKLHGSEAAKTHSANGLDGRDSIQTALCNWSTTLHRRMKKKYKMNPEKVAAVQRDAYSGAGDTTLNTV